MLSILLTVIWAKIQRTQKKSFESIEVVMDFVKLQQLPRVSASIEHDSDTRKFKAYKKRLEESCGAGTDVSGMVFSPSSETTQLAVACGSKVQIYDIGFGTASEVVSWSKHKNLIHSIAFRKDGKLLIAVDGDGHANIYDVGITKSIIRRLRGHDGAIFSTVFCGDNSKVATAGTDQTVKIWDIPTGQIVHNLTGHTDSIRSLVSVGENGLLSAGSDGKIIYWNISEGSQISVLYHNGPVDKLAMFESGALFFSIGSGSVRMWDVRSMEEVVTSKPMPLKHTKPVTSAQVSRCGDFLATASFDMTVKITRISSWDVVSSIACGNPVTSMAWRDSAICIGLENGSWMLRQPRAADTAPNHQSSPTVITENLESTRYYKTTLLDAKNVSGSSISGKKESNADYLFRKFEYRKLIDYILDASTGVSLSVAIIDELIQRGGLVPSIRDRTVEELTQLINWCSRNLVADPRCSIEMVSQVLDAILEGNPKLVSSPPEAEAGKKFIDAIKVLSGKIGQELTLQYRSTALIGLVESVMTA